MSADAPFAMSLRVRYAECDMQGRVFNAHYLTWIDMAHTDALRQTAGGYPVLRDRGVDLVVAGAELSFRAPATFDDELAIDVAIEPPGRTSLRSRYVINRGEEVIAEATMTHVCVDARDYRKQSWPDWLRELLAAHS